MTNKEIESLKVLLVLIKRDNYDTKLRVQHLSKAVALIMESLLRIEDEGEKTYRETGI